MSKHTGEGKTLTVEAVLMGTEQNRALAKWMDTVEKYIIVNPYFPHAAPCGTDLRHVRIAWDKYKATLNGNGG